MITAKLKRLFNPGIADLDAYSPESEDHFSISVWLDVSEEGSEAADMFVLTVCSASWLAKRCKAEGPIWGRHHLIVARFDMKVIREMLEVTLAACTGDTWPEVASKVGRIAASEFEDYSAGAVAPGVPVDGAISTALSPGEVVVRNRDHSVRWRKKAPSQSEWSALWAPLDLPDRLARGEYRYVQSQTDDELVVVFTPYGGLDWNIWFDVKTGSILRIAEAR